MLYENLCGAYHCTAPNCRGHCHCHCGCGEETNLVIKGSKSRGTYAEIPRRFIQKHNARGKTPQEEARHQRGEAYVRADGYRSLPLDPHSVFAGMVVEGATWILEHLVVLALQLDRPLHPGETVWHISGERSNNNPDNLVLVASQQALTRVLSGQPLLRDDLVWRPPWTESLKRDEIVRRALAGTAG